MTPKEKAEKLVQTYDEKLTYLESKNKAKECALIAVDEALNVFIEVHKALQTAGLLKFYVEEAATYKFWQEVKKEIEKI